MTLIELAPSSSHPDGARTGDVIGAKWDEIDGNCGRSPAGGTRPETNSRSRCPSAPWRSSPACRAIGDFIFPGAKKGKPLSNAAMLELLRGVAGNGYTVHGFRSTFRDWAGDRTNHPREVIEAAMSHRIKDKAEAAYRRSSALEKRRLLMEEWADFCMSPAIEGAVVAFHKKATA